MGQDALRDTASVLLGAGNVLPHVKQRPIRTVVYCAGLPTINEAWTGHFR
jgi:hypothetical protein